MLLSNLCIAGDKTRIPKHIRIKHGNILSVSDLVNKEVIDIDLEGAVAFPGFINSHDHLDFNLFPAIGNHTYQNYREWGRDIHANNKPAIDNILQIPAGIRIQWGLYKNLINGFTTVVNHGKKLAIQDHFVQVHQENQSLHSPSFEKGWKCKLNNPFFVRSPVVIHIGEGTDKPAHEEITRLINWNLLQKDLVGIHGVAMDDKQAAHFKALVWCPASNKFLLGKTAPIHTLKKNTCILFGSDSTLTAEWDIWQHIRLALSLEQLTQEELLAALTSSPAKIWGLNNCGTISEGKQADLVVGINQHKNGNGFSFINGPDDILLVIQHGIIRLFDASLYDSLANRFVRSSSFTKIRTGRQCKYVFGNLTQLAEETKLYCPGISLPVKIEA